MFWHKIIPTIKYQLINFFKAMKSYTTLFTVHTCFHVFPHVICGGQRTTFRILYSPFNIWAPGTELRYHTWVPHLLFHQTLIFYFYFFMPLELVTSLLLQLYMSRDCRCESWCLFQSPPTPTYHQEDRGIVFKTSQMTRNPDELFRTYRELGGNLDFRVRDDKCLLF